MKLKRKLVETFFTGGVTDFKAIDIEKDMEILNSFPNPNNTIERSVFQYLCQRTRYSVGFITRVNLLSLIPVLLIFVVSLLNPFPYIFYNRLNKKNIKGINIGISNSLIPKKFHDVKKYDTKFRLYYLLFLDFSDLFDLLKVCFDKKIGTYFILKCLFKASKYKYLIMTNSLEYIISSSEYSFTSSYCTHICNKNSVRSINVMHGEKLFNIRDSFCRYDEFWIWDIYYEKVLSDLRGSVSIYNVYNPHTNIINNDINQTRLLTYYLQDEVESELHKLNSILVDLVGQDFYVRPHPILSDVNTVRSIFGDRIDNLILSDSLFSSKYICSKYSTVLYQAYSVGLNIILDDISNDQLSNKLCKLGYILSNKDGISRLSNFKLTGSNDKK
ncbi:hypothetical protein AB6C45_20425 [Vibrio splendidus]